MSAITTDELDTRLYGVSGAVSGPGSHPATYVDQCVRRYADGLTKAPRPVIVWHLLRLVARVVLGRAW